MAEGAKPSILRTGALIGAGIAGYFLDGIPGLNEFTRYMIMAAGIVLLVGLSVYEYVQLRRDTAQVLNSEQAYLDKMAEFLNNNHHVTVVTRRGDWIKHGSAIWHKLAARARDGRLDLFLIKKNRISDQLAKVGANVFYYEHLGLEPNGGFTMLTANNLRKVAIGWWMAGRSDRRKLQIYYSADDPAVEIAFSQVQLLRNCATKHVDGE
jgi:hypothetical protein